MKKHIAISLILLLQTLLFSQEDPAYPPAQGALPNIVYVEYFFDSDPGFGNGTEILITPNTNLNSFQVSIPVNELEFGIHSLYIRSRDENGKWSLAAYKTFSVDFDPPYTSLPLTPNIVAAEYYYDNDPGIGNGTPIAVTPGTDISNFELNANIESVPVGIHTFYLRTQDANGKWSLTARKQFVIASDPEYPTAPSVPSNIIAVEYFINEDPGLGLGTPININPGIEIEEIQLDIDVSSLPNGIHHIYVRSRNADGKWSLTAKKRFSKGDDVIWTIQNQWKDNLEPAPYRNVIIEGDLIVGTDYPSFEAMNLTVSAGGSITIAENNSVTLNGIITNNASATDFIVASGANLIQKEIFENIGQITVLRNNQPFKRLDYTFWSSPVLGQQIQAFSPSTLPNRIYI